MFSIDLQASVREKFRVGVISHPTYSGEGKKVHEQQRKQDVKDSLNNTSLHLLNPQNHFAKI